MKNKNDYKDGIKMLKKYLYENHLYTTYYGISNKYKWIFKLSEVLSYFGVCKIFWERTIEQNGINQIHNCKVIEDIFYDRFFFIWDKTKEGEEFWYEHAEKIINRFYKLYMTCYLDKKYENNDLDKEEFVDD